MKINKANDTATTSLLSGLGDAAEGANPISSIINTVTDFGKALVDSCNSIAITAHNAFVNGLSINAQALKDNKVKHESNTGLYIAMGVLFVGVIVVASLRTKKK